MEPQRCRSFSDRKRKINRREISDDTINKYLAKKAIKATNKVKDRFVWLKKIERDVGQGAPLHEFTSKAEKMRKKERMAEIEKVKRRREQRALEKTQCDEELSLLARERSRAEADDFGKKEAEFLLSQSKLRSQIRLREGRAKPIDALTAYLADSHELDYEPSAVFNGLTVSEIENLREDIDMPVKLDRGNVEYWESLLVVCDWELAEARRGRVQGNQGIHQSVDIDVREFLEGKSHGELVNIQSQIDSNMRSGCAKVVEFWEDVLKHLHIYKSKARLKEIHDAKMLRKRHQCLEQPLEGTDNLKLEESEPDKEVEEEEVGSFSPQLLHGDEAEEAIDPEEDKAVHQVKRLAVLEAQRQEEGDGVLGSGAQVNLDSRVHWWHEKYRPRKPKYLNHVHTGYEWNKYNQTHYDHDNPPPKFVRGYKFNIFYPDLVDKTMRPAIYTERDGDNGETCIIRFEAGPPYEDIAFRIVNKAWDYSGANGFKSEFERGILKLYFNFKRRYYRR